MMMTERTIIKTSKDALTLSIYLYKRKCRENESKE